MAFQFSKRAPLPGLKDLQLFFAIHPLLHFFHVLSAATAESWLPSYPLHAEASALHEAYYIPV